MASSEFCRNYTEKTKRLISDVSYYTVDAKPQKQNIDAKPWKQNVNAKPWKQNVDTKPHKQNVDAKLKNKNIDAAPKRREHILKLWFMLNNQLFRFFQAVNGRYYDRLLNELGTILFSLGDERF